MDAHQTEFSNPFGMDTDCENCRALCETRQHVVHGYGDVGAEFLVVGENPDIGSDHNGIPFTGMEDGNRLRSMFRTLGFIRSPTDAVEPDVQNVFFTYLTRCRHPERRATDEEIANCEPFLTAEIRMINPEIIVPVGQRTLEALAIEYTTRTPESFDIDAEHATTVRGRGFELVPMKSPTEMTDAEQQAFVDHLKTDVLSRDYRQTKGRQSR